jgi:hypothetical protein
LDRRQHRRQELAILRRAVSAFLTGGSDLVAACDRLVGRRRVARVGANNDEGLAEVALHGDEADRHADRELEDVYWAAFQRQEQVLLVLPDVEDELIKECGGVGDNAWGRRTAGSGIATGGNRCASGTTGS